MSQVRRTSLLPHFAWTPANTIEACLPSSVLTSNSDPSSYPKFGTHKSRDHTNATNPGPLTQTDEVGGGTGDSSSTKNLADLETARRSGSREEKKHEFVGTVSKTIIKEPSSAVVDGYDVEGQTGKKVIHVKNEMSVSYETI